MKTFYNILQTLVGVSNKVYPDELFELRDIDYNQTEENIHALQLINKMHFIFINTDIKNNLNKMTFSKFMALNTLLENSFYDNELKEKLLTIFSLSQKYYFSFIRFAHIYKMKRNQYVVTDDLTLNPLNINHKFTYTLVENKSNYLFNINELITIIEIAIGNSPNFFCQPLWPENPYNKQKFTISTLYNIYFQIKSTGRIIPLLFHLFFLENFNTEKFSEQYELIIRENAIKKYVFNSPYTVLHKSICLMLSSNIYTSRLTIHNEFPKDLLVNIFRPYLFYFYIINYLDNSTKYFKAKKILMNKLKKFYEYNKLFGRKMFKLTKINNKFRFKEYFINTKHISFYDNCRTNTIGNDEYGNNEYGNNEYQVNADIHDANNDDANNDDNNDDDGNNDDNNDDDNNDDDDDNNDN
jgi:hypothetical protein